MEPDPKWEGLYTITYRENGNRLIKRKHCGVCLHANLEETKDAVFFEHVPLEENVEIIDEAINPNT